MPRKAEERIDSRTCENSEAEGELCRLKPSRGASMATKKCIRNGLELNWQLGVSTRGLNRVLGRHFVISCRFVHTVVTILHF